MRKAGFYTVLAAQNIRKNGKFYLPYLLTCVGAAAMLYIMLFLNSNEGVIGMPGAGELKTILGFGSAVIAIFSAILLFYTNSFLMKRRRKELGLYNVLGMEKSHIARILAWEATYTALIGVAGGILAGLLFSKLLLLLLCSLLKFKAPFGFSVSVPGIYMTCAVFCAIFALNLLVNLWQIKLSRPIELLLGGNTGEREPKTRLGLTLVGILTLGAGYGIAISVRSPLSALGMFFIAVLLVIAGTYCLFTAGSIVLLKLLRKNKAYYYQTRHFTAVSGMLYRMRRNALGLASICILSTMVLVTVSGTLCFYLGVEDALRTRFPHDISVTYPGPASGVAEKAAALILGKAAKHGIEIQSLATFEYLEAAASSDGERLTLGTESPAIKNLVYLTLISDAEYARLSGNAVSLKSGEALVQTAGGDIPPYLDLPGHSLTVKQYIDDFPMRSEWSAKMAKEAYFVVNKADLDKIESLGKDPYGLSAGSLSVDIYVDLACSKEEQIAFYNDISQELKTPLTGVTVDENGVPRHYEYEVLHAECRAANSEHFYALYGGFFFLGLFLGTLFLMATVLIIYYKQVSEGYEDAERFRIMQQVGMSRREVWISIKSQILTVFFLPLAAAAVHIAAAFPMISRLIFIFNITNVGLFAWCTFATVLAFALIYALVYALTARSYYQIVRT